MNKRQKEMLEQALRSEKDVLKSLENNFVRALADIKRTIQRLLANPLTSSKIYQLEYQEMLRQQIIGALDVLHTNNFTAISDYLSACYESGFIGTVYDSFGQGVPLMLPFYQDAIIQAVSKTADGYKLSDKLGGDMMKLRKQVQAEISRGLATGMTYQEIARNISNYGESSYKRAVNIAQTEGHRIQNESAFDVMGAAKDKGADIVKQWDSTMDGKTRVSHRELDGQIREMDEPFEVNGKSAMYPGGFGDPSEDCRCRCALLQRARWALDEEELQTLKDQAAFYGLDKAKDFEDFKKKYLKALDEDGIIRPGPISGGHNPFSKEAEEHAKRYYASVRSMKTDCANISRNTGILEDQIRRIKNFIFVEKHDLGGSEPQRFAPSYAMAESWRRLIDGKDIQPHDLTLLRHEIMEKELMSQGYTQDEAHHLTSQKYNYDKEMNDYYGKIDKHKKR